jgi:radical SAM superfamily enzyme YgiQ (UPF0313 family)
VLANYRNGKYGSLIYGSPSDIVMTSRGCPFQCGFCFKVCSRYRARSPENVLAEIDWIAHHIRPQYIQVMDDSFTINRRRCERILDGLIERQYPCHFKVRSRVNAVDEDLLRKMKKARVDTIVYGLESGSQTMLDAFSKKTTVQDNIRACRLTRQAGIACLGDMILFYPGETRHTLEETRRFVRRAGPTAVKYFVLTPLPKTQVYEESKKNGTLRGDWNLGSETPWVKLDEFKDLAEMERIAKRMFLETMLSPRSIFSMLRYYGFSLLRNPALAMRLVTYSLLKKRKY